jgi:hypothetical protein
MAKVAPPKPPQISIEEFQQVRENFAQRGPGDRVEQFKTLATHLLPGWFEFHSWCNKIIEAGCKHRWIGESGCSNSSKTRHTAGFAAVWWLADPENSAVCFCSTTMKMLRKRGWAEIQDISNKIEGWGNFVNSQCVWQVTQGDDKHCIFGKAVCEGDTNKVAADIQGLHVKRLMIVIDEAEAVPAAIWKACANLYGYCEDVGGEFVLFAIANARSRLSQFGRFIEPEDGWNSVSVDSDEWMSKPQMDGRKAKVLRFDFLKSPNIVEGKLVSRHLPTRQRVDNRMAALRARGGENDPDHFTYDRGYPVPEGLLKTVFTETLIAKHDGYGRHKFLGTNFRIIGAFDQAFGGGDRPALRFAAMGDIEGNKLGLEWMEAIILYLDANSPDPVRYQLKDKLKQACENVEYRGQKYQCRPEDLAIDCTGDGGLADICHQEWSSKINRIIFSESPSESPVSNEDERSSKDVFLNKRVQMYFQTRDALIAGQIKGIDKDTAAELCNLEELIEKSDGTIRPKKTLQTKKDYKLKYTVSPDLSDSAVMLTEVARIKGFSVAAVGLTVSREGALEQIVKDSQDLYNPDSFYSAENDEVLVEDEW